MMNYIIFLLLYVKLFLSYRLIPVVLSKPYFIILRTKSFQDLTSI